MGKVRIGGVVAAAALMAVVPAVAAAGTTQEAGTATGWRQVAIPSIDGENFLTDVAVFGTRDAWAVGRADQAMILHWDGTTWTRVPGPGSDSFAAQAVTGTSGSDVWVAGHCAVAPESSETPCAVHWNGTEWSRTHLLPQPSIGTTVTVKAISRDDVWIAGGQLESAYYVHWDGETWSRVAAPASGEGQHIIQSVTAFGTGDVWAAGYRLTGNGADQPLIQHWDGTRWSTVATPAVPGSSRLHSIVALPGGRLWAVGQGTDQAVVLRRSGGVWRRAPRVPGTDTFATGVAGDGRGGVWVALTGAFPAFAPAATVRTHYAHWNGERWALAEGGDHPGSIRSWHLARVPGTTSLWAVGGHTDQAGSHAYIEAFGRLPG